ncbi:MAG: heat-inducible transcriptional repressor HrcA [Bacilli bacterium]|nr:heat-inducible transcriptional repressor HrcA [Bacilli bacterium]
MVGDVMITNRQEALLKLIVEEHIKTAKTVSSKSLCDNLNCSSATVRNEMANLEELDLIEKTHISSGRIPSEKGYRYYVDNIMEPKKITGEDMLKLQTIFHNKSLMISDAILKSMEIISELTSYTSIVLGSSSKDNRLSKIEAVRIDENRIIAIVITDKGHVEHKNIFIESTVSIEEVQKTIDLINKLIVGTPIEEISSKLEFEIKPIISRYVTQYETLYNSFYKAFSDFSNDLNIRITGASNILKQPEFNDANKIGDILRKFDDREFIRNVMEEDKGINIYVGSENEFDNDVGLIKTSYSINGEVNTIAIIGPKRMEYDRVLALLEYIKKNIGG